MNVSAVKAEPVGPTLMQDHIPVPLNLKNTMFVERRRTMRRGNMEQGRALEMLGHAVEYLVDSRLFGVDERTVKSNQEAVQILMRLSRAVFSECPEVVPVGRKFNLWMRGMVDKVIGEPVRGGKTERW
ncbi:hypothetical protein [Granulicella tundricola]|uniref:Uncharacterized protein n=1 Tax=Granulicella tundricola (strain ATCC BAA-1859 / DSM 23138 / MP5ACTX9) TaxID=1198114 RepID=E8X2L1_GRATM|nr:hypothetical protein [Granulicella tundricola]ADW69235.1 hypothetical protein AciX9_2191 [Granulicella tundricola MP5ACTX9]